MMATESIKRINLETVQPERHQGRYAEKKCRKVRGKGEDLGWHREDQRKLVNC